MPNDANYCHYWRSSSASTMANNNTHHTPASTTLPPPAVTTINTATATITSSPGDDHNGPSNGDDGHWQAPISMSPMTTPLPAVVMKLTTATMALVMMPAPTSTHHHPRSAGEFVAIRASTHGTNNSTFTSFANFPLQHYGLCSTTFSGKTLQQSLHPQIPTMPSTNRWVTVT